MILAHRRSHVHHHHSCCKHINFVLVLITRFGGEFRGKELDILGLDCGSPSHSFGQIVILSDRIEVCKPHIPDLAIFAEHESLRVYSSVHDLLLHQSAENLDYPFIHLHQLLLGERSVSFSSLFTVLL